MVEIWTAVEDGSRNHLAERLLCARKELGINKVPELFVSALLRVLHFVELASSSR